MTPYRPGIDVDRRKGPDLGVKLLHWFVLIGWLLMFLALIIASLAKPQTQTFFDRVVKLGGRTTWNQDMARYILYSMVLGLFISFGGLYINLKRNRRREDELRVSFILIGFLSAIGIVIYLILFS